MTIGAGMALRGRSVEKNILLDGFFDENICLVSLKLSIGITQEDHFIRTGVVVASRGRSRVHVLGIS